MNPNDSSFIPIIPYSTMLKLGRVVVEIKCGNIIMEHRAQRPALTLVGARLSEKTGVIKKKPLNLTKAIRNSPTPFRKAASVINIIIPYCIFAKVSRYPRRFVVKVIM